MATAGGAPEQPSPPAPRSPAAAPPAKKRRGCLRALGVAAVLLVVGSALGLRWWRSDLGGRWETRSFALEAPPHGAGFFAGAAAVDITPALDPARPVWIAGFGTGRRATGVHDPLWARALYLERNGVRVAIVAVDLIGFFYEQVNRCRDDLDDEVDYLLVASTHTHEGPDTLGMWGSRMFACGVDPDYLARVRGAIVEATRQAARARRPALALARSTRFGAGEVVIDHERRPFVIDDTLGVLHVVEEGSRTTIGTLVSWSSHPEVMEDRNTLLSSDYPHWLREGVERGVGLGGARPVAGLGGVCVFVNGAVGGMITSMAMDLRDRESGEVLRVEPGEPVSWKRPQAVGDRVAEAALGLVRAGAPEAYAPLSRLRVRAKGIAIPLDNPTFRLAAKLGTIERSTRDGAAATEVAIVDLGPVRLGCVPGEIYPEIVIGGIESPHGADHPGAAVEVPPLRDALATGIGVEHVFVVGLANDELGYFIPRTEWDAAQVPWSPRGAPPHLYGAAEPPYGEINSCGPHAAQAVHQALLELAADRPAGPK